MIYLLLGILVIVSMWMIFEKRGEPGWQCLIPVWNGCVLAKIAGQPMWYGLLLFVPIVNIIFHVVICLALARSFGRGTGFALGLAFLPVIFYPILAFA